MIVKQYVDERKPLISVIVPVYGVEKYINKCVDSILSQTYNNLEILLIDDGTLDRSGIICDEYARKDTRIKVFHKENGGLSDARNYGIQHANGDYMTFVDSDDYIDNDYVEFLYNLLASGNYKLSICSIHVLYTSNNRICNKGNGNTVTLSGKKCIEMMCYHKEVDTAAYAKLYHRDLFKNVRFPKGKIFEDIGTSYLLFEQCSNIICSFVPKYWYVIREGSIVTSDFNEKKLDLLEMTDKMAAHVCLKYPDLSRAVLRRQGYARLSTLNQMLNLKDEKYDLVKQQLIEFLKSNAIAICADYKTPIRDKIAYLCLLIGFPVYRFCWNIYIKHQRG